MIKRAAATLGDNWQVVSLAAGHARGEAVGVLLDPGHEASLAELPELIDAALKATIARLSARAGIPPLTVATDWNKPARWGIRAQNTAERVLVLGAARPPLGPAHWWHKPVGLTLQSADLDATATVFVPWLLDDDALGNSEIACQLGGSEGLYVGGLRIPSIISSMRPGLHRLALRAATRPANPDNVDLAAWGLVSEGLDSADSPERERHDAILVPDLGDKIPISLGRRRGKRFDWAAERVARILAGTDSDRLLLTSTREAIEGLVDLNGTWQTADDDMARVLERWLQGEGDLPVGVVDEPVTVTDRAGSRLQFWGQALAFALHRGIRSSERQIAQRLHSGLEGSLEPAGVAEVLAWCLGSALKHLIAGDEPYTGLHNLMDSTSTISRIEAYRQVSFYGPGALSEVRNRLDLRDLDEAWRHVLCPLQTPESSKVGLVRYLSSQILPGNAGTGLDALVETWGDLSVSACLVPFVDCDDSAKSSTGAKNLKQAVPVIGAEPPRVRTGWETRLAEIGGVARSPVTGQLVESSEFHSVVRRGRSNFRMRFGAGWSPSGGPQRAWTPTIADNEVAEGDIVANAPDVRVDDDSAALAFGVNAFVALTPWHGLNHEDGIVVSASYAAKLASTERIVVREPFDPNSDGDVTSVVGVLGDSDVRRGTPVAIIEARDGDSRRAVLAPEHGRVVDVRCVGGRVEVSIDVDRPLRVGDKLTNRHGGKGVVCRILPDAEMPYVELPPPVRDRGSAPVAGPGTTRVVIDAILNPLGVLRRLNIGQLWEMHASLAVRLSGSDHVIVGRRPDDPDRLADELRAGGAKHGRLPLFSAAGVRLDDGDGVVVGDQYIVKLDHLAANKVRSRGADSPRSPRTWQPSRQTSWHLGRRGAPAQRMGEMELWALTALDARALLDDVVNVRGLVGGQTPVDGVKPTLTAVAAHLAVAGFRLSAIAGGATESDLTKIRPGSADRLVVVTDSRKFRTVDNEFLKQIAASRYPRSAVSERDHALYDARHGSTRARREQIRWAIELPFAVPHPWETRKTALPAITVVPILPPALRAFGQDPLDRRYALLAAAILRMPANVDPVVSGWADRMSVLVDAVLGRSTTVDQAARRGERCWPVAASSGDKEETRPVATPLEGTDEWYDTVADGARPRSHPRTAIDPGPTIAQRLRDKQGLLRRSLLGHAVQRSGRAVIVGDPQRDAQTVGLPASIIETIIDPLAIDDHRDVVLVNRQPTLRPNALLALRAEAVPGDAIVLNPAVLDCLAGDFDGDTAAVHWPESEAARRQAWERLRPAAQLVNYGARSSWLAKLDLDVALGLLLITEPDSDDARREVADRLNPTQWRRRGPARRLVIDGPLDKRGVAQLVETAGALSQDDKDSFVAILENAVRLGAEGSTGWSIGAIELLKLKVAVDKDGEVVVRFAGKEMKAAAQRINQLRAIGALKDDELLQLLHGRGAVATGRVDAGDLPEIEGRYLDGLLPTEAYLAARGGILKLATKKLVTPLAGDLTKQLVEIGYEIRVGVRDCGAEGARGPLHCQSPPPEICERCSRGWLPSPDAAPGILAAMVIGQRTTQLALKANRASTQKPAHEQVAAIFGTGGFAWPASVEREVRDAIVGRRLAEASSRSDGRTLSARTRARLISRPVTLMELLDPIEAPGAALWDATAPVRAVFVELFGGNVDPFWAQILWRQLWAESRAKPATLTRSATYAGKGALSRSSVRGNLDRLVDTSGTQTDLGAREPRRTSLLIGSWQ